jgi:RNA polymerase sigma-70 factor (ECF subfamily)
LPEEFRAPVVLRDLCELDYAEIAEVLGIPPGTVRSRIARGRAALARALGNQADPGARQTSRP